MAFVPLHNHSDYSLLDGASQLPAMVERAVALGMPAPAWVMENWPGSKQYRHKLLARWIKGKG